MHAGKKIKIIRAIKGLSQQELAEKVGRTRALISHIELTGKVNHYTLVQILRVFKMTEEDFEKYHPKESMKLYSEEELKEEYKELKEKFGALEKERDMLRDLVDSYKKYIRKLEGEQD